MSELERVRKHVEAALAYGGHDHTFEDIADLVDAGKAQAWFGPDSVVITEIVEAPRKTSLGFILAGGHLNELEAMFPRILEWGKTQGCTRATSVGRRGWERTFLTRTGWTADMVVFQKDIT